MNLKFSIGERVVYPSHGVGEIINIDSQEIGNITIEVYVISFSKSNMILKIPVNRAVASGLRPIITKDDISKIYEKLQENTNKQTNKMWSRRAQEYEAKINSGDLIAVAEVLNVLSENVNKDRSYSERTIFELALNRLASEIAILEEIDIADATNKLIDILKDKTKTAA